MATTLNQRRKLDKWAYAFFYLAGITTAVLTAILN